MMKDIRVDKTMVDGKATFKTININKSASQDDKELVPGGSVTLTTAKPPNIEIPGL
jgi:hypothetical protein